MRCLLTMMTGFGCSGSLGVQPGQMNNWSGAVYGGFFWPDKYSALGCSQGHVARITPCRGYQGLVRFRQCIGGRQIDPNHNEDKAKDYPTIIMLQPHHITYVKSIVFL